jgi:hypothetical protein
LTVTPGIPLVIKFSDLKYIYFASEALFLRDLCSRKWSQGPGFRRMPYYRALVVPITAPWQFLERKYRWSSENILYWAGIPPHCDKGAFPSTCEALRLDQVLSETLRGVCAYAFAPSFQADRMAAAEINSSNHSALDR